MTEHSPSSIGTVAQEAARLIEDMATMARIGYSGANDASPSAGWTSQEHVRAEAPPSAGDREAGGTGAHDEPVEGACSMCGAQGKDTEGADTAGADTAGADTASACKICPLCRGISLLRSVRPETVDLLADLAMSVAGSLRDMAMWSRAAEPASPTRTSSASSPEADRAPVQDILVDDEGEG
jgi:hypothetical protein